jgi:membrane protease YdiL (CAAX protease family)
MLNSDTKNDAAKHAVLMAALVMATIFVPWLPGLFGFSDATYVQLYWYDMALMSCTVLVALSYRPFRQVIWKVLHLRNNGDHPPQIFWMQQILIIVMALAVFKIFFPLISDPFHEWFPPPPFTNYGDISIWFFLGEILLAYVLGAIEEEFTFRIVIRNAVERFTSSRVALYLISILIFGLAHWQKGVSSMVYAMLTGAVLMYLYVRSGSIIPSIVAHYLSNAIWLFQLRGAGVHL